MKEVWGAMKTITGCKNNSGSSVDGGVDRANQFNTFFNSIHHPVFTTITLTSTISVTFTTITLTSTISVITTINTMISRKTKQLPQFPLSPNLHGRQETAEETTHQEGGRPRQSVPQNA
ncbi:hypothetical protein NFI96_003575 [Prochilodus magdalenae]|nr:hypothetical protein NFI96_003575 [Prochilodus magdalenae]